MTVEVETPSGIRVGSSVIQVNVRKSPAFPGPEAGGRQVDARGEAAAVPLPDGRTLFALLKNHESGEEAAGLYALKANHLRLPLQNDTSWRQQIDALKQQAGPAELPLPSWPMLVMFADPRDPRTVYEASPLSSNSFKVRRVTIQITTDKVTRKIDNFLPWLRTINGGYLDGTPDGSKGPLNLHAGNFSR